MRKYWTSDYAVNKDREGIVYQFADGSETEISLAEYLHNNPDKTEQDFMELKALSDGIYYEQALEDSEQFATPPPDMELIHKADEDKAIKAAKQLLESGKLTEVQRRRFILHYFEGLSIRRIAALDGVDFRAVWDSLYWSAKKLKKFYSE